MYRIYKITKLRYYYFNLLFILNPISIKKYPYNFLKINNSFFIYY